MINKGVAKLDKKELTGKFMQMPKNYYLCTRLLTLIFFVMAYKISESECAACGTCVDECPSAAISAGDVYSIDPDLCQDCGVCADACPVGAISPA
jgi:ferredoxin